MANNNRKHKEVNEMPSILIFSVNATFEFSPIHANFRMAAPHT